GYAGNVGNNQASGTRVVNPVGNEGANQPMVIRCYNCNGKGHIAKQCAAKKRVKDSEWSKDKMLLAQAQEARVLLNDKRQDFLADNYDDEATTNAIFMVSLSPVGYVNDDMVEPRYDFAYSLRRTIDQSAGGKLGDKNAKESWEIFENLALYDYEGWNDSKDFTKPVKEISLP
ncbi:integrase, catalytic region, zinc finger, CCHC-type containing protein, partial [Tanacetum coccineum]